MSISKSDLYGHRVFYDHGKKIRGMARNFLCMDLFPGRTGNLNNFLYA